MIAVRMVLLHALLVVSVVPACAQAPVAGRYEARGITMTLGADGRATFTSARGLLVAAAYTLDGARIVFRDDGGAVSCPDHEGRYEWRLEADTIRFRLIEDPCEGRRAALAAPWARAAAALVLTGLNLIDGTGAPVQPGMTLVLERGVIAAIHADGAVAAPEGAVVRGLRDHWILPGLVDAHVHLATNPSGQDRRNRVERRLRNALRGGVVAVRDMGGDARALADLARAAAAGDIESPLIAYGAIMAGPEFFGDPRVLASSAGLRPGSAPWARAVTDTTDLHQVMAEARGAGARAVKLYADLDADQVARVARAATQQGLLVWSHFALMPARPSDVVRGGVAVASHATLLAWEASAELPGHEQRAQIDPGITGSHPAVRRVLEDARERGVLFEPTLFVYRASPALPDTAQPRRREAQAVDLVRAAHAAGVRIVAGTDGMGGEVDGALPNIHEELRLLVAAGLTPMDALVAATRNAAEAAGMQATHGTLAVGMAADLLVLSADPTADIRNTREIAMVIRRGQAVER
jgi:imidazolonepropionase-like amidohydrolase